MNRTTASNIDVRTDAPTHVLARRSDIGLTSIWLFDIPNDVEQGEPLLPQSTCLIGGMRYGRSL